MNQNRSKGLVFLSSSMGGAVGKFCSGRSTTQGTTVTVYGGLLLRKADDYLDLSVFLTF
jgi:hypothetical protein